MESPVLDILAVDPEHQSEGAGTKLIHWGLEHADRMGAEVILNESSASPTTVLSSANSRPWSRAR